MHVSKPFVFVSLLRGHCQPSQFFELELLDPKDMCSIMSPDVLQCRESQSRLCDLERPFDLFEHTYSIGTLRNYQNFVKSRLRSFEQDLFFSLPAAAPGVLTGDDSDDGNQVNDQIYFSVGWDLLFLTLDQKGSLTFRLND